MCLCIFKSSKNENVKEDDTLDPDKFKAYWEEWRILRAKPHASRTQEEKARCKELGIICTSRAIPY
jgi:hypothetical protein